MTIAQFVLFLALLGACGFAVAAEISRNLRYLVYAVVCLIVAVLLLAAGTASPIAR